MRAIFNSWDTKYKQPFGATRANTSVKWAVEVDEEIQEITLWLTKNNESPVAYPMTFNDESKMYETRVKISSSGLYYYFNIKQNDQFYFLERSQDGFGDGEITQDGQDIRTFQLTCYDRAVPQAVDPGGGLPDLPRPLQQRQPAWGDPGPQEGQFHLRDQGRQSLLY
jgi:cyclomaltodextrinase / maltogenic alpha-amylase / neopullulanase